MTSDSAGVKESVGVSLVDANGNAEQAGPKAPPSIHTNLMEGAPPINVNVQVPADTIKKLFDDYWDSVKDNIPEGLKAKALKGHRQITRERIVQVAGGRERFYHPVITKIVMEEVAANSAVLDLTNREAREVLTITSVGVTDGGDKGAWGINAVVYLEPKVTLLFPVTSDLKFKAKVPSIDDTKVLEQVNHRLVEIQGNFAVYEPVERDTPAVGDWVTITLKYSFDGKPAPEIKDQRVEYTAPTDKNFSVANLLPFVKTKGIPTVFEYVQPGAAGQTDHVFKGTIEVTAIHSRKLTAMDDNLAIDAGFKTYVQMFNQIKKEVEDQITKNVENQTTNAIVRNLMEQSTVSPVPETWAANKAEELFQHQCDQFGGETKLLKMMRATKDQVLSYHAINVSNQLRMNLVIRALGRAMKIEGDTTLGSTYNYADSVRKHLLNTMVVEPGEKVEVLGFVFDKIEE